MTPRRSILLCVAVLVLGWMQPGNAQDAIDRPLTIYVAGTAGGGIDLYARLLARHFGRHLAGNPTVTVQVMPGAGGIRAANFLAQQAPRDGSAIATFAGGPILEPLIGARNAGYDMSSFTWLGAMTRDIGLCIAWATTPFKTIDDVKRQQMVVAGTGAGSETDTWPVVLNDVLGTKFKLVTGYLGSQETILAIERGEAHGRCVFSHSALKVAKPDWLRDNKINVLVLTALARSVDFPGVPAVVDLVSKPEDRQLLELMVGPGAMARSFAAPPGLPAGKATLLRRAFDATMQDPDFRAEAGRIKADLAPTPGEAVQALVARIYATPRPVVERVKKLLAP
ncbi:MAG TPA: tripartite tricarboxylate transporter substrate-binding protein [Xanthobacteraceae bacterium]|jgi:tripartite-type tricarboxylate transporter receptor subunit TctC